MEELCIVRSVDLFHFESMALAIFDLDNTILNGDSDYLWGTYLCDIGIVDRQYYEQKNHEFHEDYKAGHLDIYAFQEFSLEPLKGQSMEDLLKWRKDFVDRKIKPLVTQSALALVEKHQHSGDTCLIITATSSFVTHPIAHLFGIDTLIGTDPEIINNQMTGKIAGQPSFQHGKVIRLQSWAKEHGHSLKGASFYSDSVNDIPLLELVDYPYAVDPDPQLLQHAKDNLWPVIWLHRKIA